MTGGKGVHVIAPLARRAEWPAVKAFARGFAGMVAADDPERYVAQAAKAKRKGRIFVDWLRNERGSTAIAPYSTRAKPGAPVATPVGWDELGGWRARRVPPGRHGGAAGGAGPVGGGGSWKQSLTKGMLAKVGAE